MNFKKNIARVKEMLNLKNTKHMQLVYIRTKDRSLDRLILVQNARTSSPFFAFCLLVCLFLFRVCVCLSVCVCVYVCVCVSLCVIFMGLCAFLFVFCVCFSFCFLSRLLSFPFVFYVVFLVFTFGFFFVCFLGFFCFFVCCFFIISKDGDCTHLKHLPEVKIKITYNVPLTK